MKTILELVSRSRGSQLAQPITNYLEKNNIGSLSLMCVSETSVHDFSYELSHGHVYSVRPFRQPMVDHPMVAAHVG